MSTRDPAAFSLSFKGIVLRTFLTFLVLSPIIAYGLSSYIAYLNDSGVFKPWVSFYGDPAHEVYISWQTETAEAATVYYGTEPESLVAGPTSEAIESAHVNLTGLNANKRYFYEVRVSGEVIGTGEFRTAPEGYAPFKFVMFSDTQQPKIAAGHHYRLARNIQAENYTFCAIAGDLVDDGSDYRHYNNFFQTASTYTDTIPLAPCIGNHDTKGEMHLWTKYFKNAVNKLPSTEFENGQFYYSFNWSSVHFSVCHFTYGHSYDFTDAQMDWIEQDLQNSKDMPFRVVMFHCPIAGAGFFGRNYNLETQLLPILKTYNVTAVINGHEHHFERGFFEDPGHEMGGVSYFILGGGGGAFDPGLSAQPETKIMTPTPCYTEVSADSTSIKFTTRTVEGKMIDTYMLEGAS